ncbi:RUXE-like protein [Mya arenaria]|uniref:RUXE-like protein n=1 Tax=Mya arenaria TaxID=6604 RepID=A0ABY7EF83_MYAAR|nr:RUXE-like protein [Mya arenaria]
MALSSKYPKTDENKTIHNLVCNQILADQSEFKLESTKRVLPFPAIVIPTCKHIKMAYKGGAKVQKKSRVQVWLYEQVNLRIEGCIAVANVLNRHDTLEISSYGGKQCNKGVADRPRRPRVL